MTRTITVLTICACVAIATVSAAKEPTWKQHPSKNAPRKHVMVQFTNTSLHPSIAQVTEGGTVSWVNYASTGSATIVLSDEVAAAFTCTELRPNWMKTGKGVQSVAITMGGATDDLQLPCPLKPGEYEYEVWLYSERTGGGLGQMGNPRSRMQGKIIVE